MVTKQELEEGAQRFNSADDGDTVMAYYDKKTIIPHLSKIKPRRIFETGTSGGTVTKPFIESAKELYIESWDIVEGSKTGIERTKNLLRDVELPGGVKINYINDLWENYNPEKPYTDILCIRSLEHVEKPVPFLEHMGECLEDDGILHIIVPNGESLHRLIDVKKGKISKWDDLTERDKQVGHSAVYNMLRLINDVEMAGLEIDYSTDFFLKQVGTAKLGKITMDPEDEFVQNCYLGAEVLHDMGIYNLGTQLYIVAKK